MGVFDVTEEDEAASFAPKLSYFSLPSQSPEPAGMLTPPFRSSGSVPFQWEVAPGKPRTCSSINNNNSNRLRQCESARCLELPPRLLSEVKMSTNTSSPTTVFEGPYMARSSSYSVSFTSFANPEHGVMGKSLSKDQRGSFREWVKRGLKGNTRVAEDNFSISPSSSSSTTTTGECSGNTKVEMITRTRRGNLTTLSLSSATTSHFWASISGTLKHVVPNPWRSRKTKSKKKDGPGLTI